MPFPMVNADRIQVSPLAKRQSDIEIEKAAVSVDAAGGKVDSTLAAQLDRLAERMIQAKQRGASIMLAYGAHLVKNGAARLVQELIRRGYVTLLATQGAGIIHDWEFAYLGRSSESVRCNTPQGRFGTWDETGRWLNLAALVGVTQGMGLGESITSLVGTDGLTIPTADELTRQICETPDDTNTAALADLLHAIRRFNLSAGRINVNHRYKQYSILNAAHESNIPLTVHPGIGYDIITNHPLFHGAALGRGAGRDARIFAHQVGNLSSGVFLSVGSAIMSPQVFEKAMSVANNLLLQEGRRVVDHSIAVVDLQDGGGWDWSQGEPPKDHPAYYLRFCKTFYRMGGSLDYLRADNRVVLAQLLRRLI